MIFLLHEFGLHDSAKGKAFVYLQTLIFTFSGRWAKIAMIYLPHFEKYIASITYLPLLMA